MAVFWVVAPCSLVDFYRRFRGKHLIYLDKGVIISKRIAENALNQL
jgi:hypothetical protein